MSCWDMVQSRNRLDVLFGFENRIRRHFSSLKRAKHIRLLAVCQLRELILLVKKEILIEDDLSEK